MAQSIFTYDYDFINGGPNCFFKLIEVKKIVSFENVDLFTINKLIKLIRHYAIIKKQLSFVNNIRFWFYPISVICTDLPFQNLLHEICIFLCCIFSFGDSFSPTAKCCCKRFGRKGWRKAHDHFQSRPSGDGMKISRMLIKKYAKEIDASRYKLQQW